MDERERYIVWYRLRGMGLVFLCSLLFFCGAYVAEQKSITVNGMGDGRRMPVCCVQTDQKKLALTFDAAVGNKNTQTILNILDKYGARATFFVTGSWVEAYPDEVKQIAQAGHDLGNHSQNHKNMTELTKSESQSEIQMLHEQVKELTGVDMNLFRPPYGDFDNELLDTVRLSGYLPIEWNVDSGDWKDYGADSVLSTVIQSPDLGSGSIILLHNGADYTAQALEQMIVTLQEQGYELVPVSELVYWEDYQIGADGRQMPGNQTEKNQIVENKSE